MLIARHHMLLPDGEVPEWIHLIPAGTFRGVDGRGPYKLTDPAAVIRASMEQPLRPVDVNHSTEIAGRAGAESPARGWITEFQAREDGIWGKVDWTAAGAEALRNREYRGFSPVFSHDKAGNVLRIHSAALTNTPNLAELKTLHQQEHTSMDLAAFRQALGLPETADEAAILAAVRVNAATIATHSQQLGTIASAAGLDATTKPEAIAVALQTRLGAAATRDEEVRALQAQVQALSEGAARTAAVAFVDAAIQAGKPIMPQRDVLIAQHMKDPAFVEGLVNGLPALTVAGATTQQTTATHAAQPGSADTAALTESDKHVARKMGLNLEQFAKFKANQKKDAA